MGALTTDEILWEEATEIFGKDFSGRTRQELYRAFNVEKPAALCLSGGGIRSAAFALGIIQALAAHPRPAANVSTDKAELSLLSDFHYLSTVSGGGYIGGWLSGWVKRVGFPNVWMNLVGRPQGPDAEPKAISWLRDHSNYLTPKLGLMSADTWTAVALYLRNLLLNWLIIIPALCAVLLSLKWFAGFVEGVAKIFPQGGGSFLVIFVGLGLVCLITALQFTTRNRPTRQNSRANQGRFLSGDLLPAISAGLFFALTLALACSHDYVRLLPSCSSASGLASPACLGWLALIGTPLAAVIYGIAWGIACFPVRSRPTFGDCIAWMISGAVYGAVMSVGLWVYSEQFVNPLAIFRSPEIILIVFMVPWALVAQLLAAMIFLGLTSYEKDSDADREWLGRAAGWYLAATLLWLILMFLVFVGSNLANALFAQFKTWLGPVGGISGVITAVLGKSRATSARGQSKSAAGISANVILAIAAPIFAAALIIATSALLDKLVFGLPLTETDFWKAPVVNAVEHVHWPKEAWWLLLWTVIIGVITAFAGVFVNINRFSLHALYRNRIIRGFLGGSNTNRIPNPFTDFDDNDNLRMYELWSKQSLNSPADPKIRTVDWQPFHVVNMALNIVSTKKLAWQQRKAESFTVSPLHCGSACILGHNDDIQSGGFRCSRTYGDEHGISLGTAVAISGAAASPNMGYHSSPPLAFLLTLFNARLGWWLGNPGSRGNKTYKKEGPPLALLPLVYEMFGLTNDDNKYVYLSDGGHFENLALYEMVRRRCRFIVVSDAGCDPNFEFEDLGNAVRKISLDLGVTIRFVNMDDLKCRAESESQAYRAQANPDIGFYAIGTIDYPSADAPDDKQKTEPGLILYIKPTFRKDAIGNVSVRSYAIANPDFPHQSTADQWFDEPQFESYRALGFEIMDRVLSNAINALTSTSPITLGDVLTKLHAMT